MTNYRIVNCDGKVVNNNVFFNHEAAKLEMATMMTMKSVYGDTLKYSNGLWIETKEA